jgi:hypothetical protein
MEFPAVAPGGELRQDWLADAHQLEPALEAGQADLVGREADRRRAELPLALLDHLPPLLDGGQVPAPTGRADHPEPAPGFVEGEAVSDREPLDLVVPAQGRVAEEAVGQHASIRRRASSTVRIIPPAHRPGVEGVGRVPSGRVPSAEFWPPRRPEGILEARATVPVCEVSNSSHPCFSSR